jgi:6-phosphogluconate dehydrogenase
MSPANLGCGGRMEIGMVGLGKMGGSMAERLLRAGHSVVGYALDVQKIQEFAGKGGVGAHSLDELVSSLSPRRAVWLMIPAGEPVEDVIRELTDLLDDGDIIIDGGNSHYRDTIRRSRMLGESGIHLLDVGTSGGIWGLKDGYCMMVGGDEEVIEHVRPALEALAPGPDRGWGRVGPPGSGHFVKMVHNGIEYGLMQAYAEGFSILRAKEDLGLDLVSIAEIWRHGSVIRSWLLDLAAKALVENPDLEEVSPFVGDSGEGRWAVAEAIDLDVSAPVMSLSLLQRLRSRDGEGFSDRIVSSLRNQFGGHDIMRE